MPMSQKGSNRKINLGCSFCEGLVGQGLVLPCLVPGVRSPSSRPIEISHTSAAWPTEFGDRMDGMARLKPCSLDQRDGLANLALRKFSVLRCTL